MADSVLATSWNMIPCLWEWWDPWHVGQWPCPEGKILSTLEAWLPLLCLVSNRGTAACFLSPELELWMWAEKERCLSLQELWDQDCRRSFLLLQMLFLSQVKPSWLIVSCFYCSICACSISYTFLSYLINHNMIWTIKHMFICNIIPEQHCENQS